MKIRFLGAVTSVTGSCHLITTGANKFLLDCGQFQGSDEIEELNWEKFDFNPEEIDFVLLSHTHIDHSGRIPLLVKRGFKGPVYCTDATADLLDVMLKDSAYIHEKEAEWKNRKNQRAGRPYREPLYTFDDAVASLKQVKPVLYNQLLEINENIKVVFNDAGHILGSSIIEIFIKEDEDISKIVFSGDIGMKNKPILKDPTIIKKADFLIMEATYGNRLHEKNSDSIERLIDIVLKTIKRGGTVVIPSFAVGRTQELIFEFNRFYEDHPDYKKELNGVMVYVDSPMATTATEVFRNNAHIFDEETKDYILQRNNPLDFKNLKFTRTVEESKELNINSEPKIIISASGMCEAGRIKHHLKHNLWNPKASIIFVGYQAEGTLGRSILNGDKYVSIFGERIRVQAEVYNLEGFSGHADKEGLLDWLSGFQKKPQEIFLVHGEKESKEEFAAAIKERFGYETKIIKGVSEFLLSKKGLRSEEEFKKAIVSPEVIQKIKNKISSVQNDLETILFNERLAADKGLTSEQITEINNIVIEIEKDTMGLASIITKENKEDIDNKD
ncbi:MAG: MBL fold metallo-hydrolase [Actinomycetota bacterium]|nr:MBL fold metallo-hydrolase [Actinomycetota bacterium]